MNVDADAVAAKKIRDAMHGSLEVAFDALLEAGWPLERLSVVHDSTRGSCMQLCIDTQPALKQRPWPYFEVMLTCELDAVDGPRVSIIERWLLEVPRPTP